MVSVQKSGRQKNIVHFATSTAVVSPGIFRIVYGLNDGESELASANSGVFPRQAILEEENDFYEPKDEPSVVRDDGMTDRLKLVLAVMVREITQINRDIRMRNTIQDGRADIVTRILILLLQKFKVTGRRLPKV